MVDYDVIIVGCGPAGLTAALFTSRANLHTAVIGDPEKSQMKMAMNIQNYFGFPDGIDGPILLNKGTLQAQKFGTDIIREEVVSADCIEQGDAKIFRIKTNRGRELSAHSLVIATGIPIRLSGIANEEKLTGKGIHYCVNCDGAFYKNKKLVIIGNGDHAVESALEALSFTKDITIVANASSFDFSPESDRELTKWQIRTELGKVKAFSGEKWFESLLFEDGRQVKFDGVFMACGTAGALDFAANLGLEIRDNILVVDDNNMTSMRGVFAAGNCTGKCRQIAKNVGDGCNAAVSVIKYMRSRENYLDYVHAANPVRAEISGINDKNNANSRDDCAKEPAKKKKLRIGWFSFSCCEDSSIVFTELLNDYYDKLRDVIEFSHVRILKAKNDMTNLDIAFVEGAIATDKAADELREIRKNCKKLVAIGSCAVVGMPSAQRNDFDERRKREIQPVVELYKYNEKVLPLHDVVQVDDNVPGCPMAESTFIALLNKYLKEFGIDAQL
jgi:thioredoxin reductase (NADPH)